MSTRLLYTGAMTQQQQALCIVDMQNAFFRDPGLQSRRAEVVTAANQLADAARAVAIPVFVISTVHSRDTSTWTLNMLEAGEGFLFQGDHGTEIVPELNIESTTMVEKTRDSAFFGTDFHLRLTNLGITRLVFAGVSTHGCIAQPSGMPMPITFAVRSSPMRWPIPARMLTVCNSRCSTTTGRQHCPPWRK